MPKRVLLVEDEPNIVESLKFLLGRAGFDVDVQMNGREGLLAARDAPPDVLVLDVMLPEINGIEVLRQLRADDPDHALPILMLTAKGQREDRDRAIQAGADLFLTKPFANADLVSAVQSLADRRPG